MVNDLTPPEARPRAELSERAQRLLKFLVERYIRDGQPVGSRTLSRESRLDLSPATIRNVMSDLEEMGLVRSPHTSAGRIPTVSGYRLFVDSLLTVSPPNAGEVATLQRELNSVEEPRRVLETASNLLSEITSMAGVVMLPKREQAALQQMEFLTLSLNRVLVIMVFDDGEVQNRIIHTVRPYGASELQQASNFLNEILAGRTLTEVREAILREMKEAQESMNQLMVVALEMAHHAVQSQGSEDYLIAGQTNLMGYAEMSNVEKLRQLFEAFNRKRDILHLLDQSLYASGIQIFIGEESGYEVLDECSLVTAPYQVEGSVVGVLGVIGPTRMAYDRVIPIVDLTARLLGVALNHNR